MPPAPGSVVEIDAVPPAPDFPRTGNDGLEFFAESFDEQPDTTSATIAARTTIAETALTALLTSLLGSISRPFRCAIERCTDWSRCSRALATHGMSHRNIAMLTALRKFVGADPESADDDPV